MIQDYRVSERPAWQLIAQEALGFVAAAALFPFGIKGSRRRTPRAADQRTVVLIHGYLANRSTLFPLAAYLSLRGVEQVLSFNYSSSAGVEQSALAPGDDLGYSGNRRRLQTSVHNQPQPAGAFGHQHASIGQKGHGPRML